MKFVETMCIVKKSYSIFFFFFLLLRLYCGTAVFALISGTLGQSDARSAVSGCHECHVRWQGTGVRVIFQDFWRLHANPLLTHVTFRKVEKHKICCLFFIDWSIPNFHPAVLIFIFFFKDNLQRLLWLSGKHHQQSYKTVTDYPNWAFGQ